MEIHISYRYLKNKHVFTVGDGFIVLLLIKHLMVNVLLSKSVTNGEYIDGYLTKNGNLFLFSKAFFFPILFSLINSNAITYLSIYVS
jgi:hypothetical protein